MNDHELAHDAMPSSVDTNILSDAPAQAGGKVNAAHGEKTDLVRLMESSAVRPANGPANAGKTPSRRARCAWRGCEAVLGHVEDHELPPGWRWMAVYKQDPNDGEVHGALCPKHVVELGQTLAFAYNLSKAAAEARKGS